MSDTIQQAISNYNKVIVDALEQMKVIHSKYVYANPEDLRKYYDRTREIIEKKTIEINERKDYIDECINNLEKCKNSIAEMEKVIEKISITLNAGMVGTLHGLCKELIKQNKIPMDEIEETVFNYHYDEKNEIEKVIQYLNHSSNNINAIAE
jgi:chromosome segregation ATPase